MFSGFLMFSIRDVVMDQFSPPFLARNKSHAVMQFEMTINKARESGFTQEFELWEVGQFDDDSGVVSSNSDLPKKVNLSKVEDEDPQKEFDL